MTPIQLQNLTSLFASAVMNNHKGFPVWFSFSGHVNAIDVSAMHGPYSNDKQRAFRSSFYLDDKDADYQVRLLRETIRDHARFNDFTMATTYHGEARA